MPSVGAVLKKEIQRLSRKEIRATVAPTRKASAQYRRAIAALKREVTQLQRRISTLERKADKSPAATPAASSTTRVRFAASGLRSQRARLGLSANDFAKLVGVSSQTIYNWEQETTRPRAEQLTLLASLRGLGKKDAESRLAKADMRNARKKLKS